MRRLLLIASAIAFAVGCNGGGNGFDGSPDGTTGETGGPDSGTDVVHTDAPHTDAAADHGDAGPGTLFGPCATTADCAALGHTAECLTAYPGGLCTKSCTNDTACSAGGGICVTPTGSPSLCLPQCTAGDNSGSCDQYGSACGAAPNDSAMRSICTASCWTTAAMASEPADYQNCPAAMMCDAYTGTCGMPTGVGTVGAGGPCASPSDCQSGECYPESYTDPTSGMLLHTGFIGGYCVTFGYALPQSDYVMGTPIPQGNCPPNSAPLPADPTASPPQGTGDQIFCGETCDLTAGCSRPGYFCSPLTTTGTPPVMFSTNGYCFPNDCSMAGQDCPAGNYCFTETFPGATMPSHVCVPCGGDAGVACPVTDAGTPDSGTPDAAADTGTVTDDGTGTDAGTAPDDGA